MSPPTPPRYTYSGIGTTRVQGELRAQVKFRDHSCTGAPEVVKEISLGDVANMHAELGQFLVMVSTGAIKKD